MDELNPIDGSPDQNQGVTRRRFIDVLLGFSVVATAVGVLVPVIGYLWPPKTASGGKGSKTQVGTVQDFPAGQGKVVAVAEKPVIIVNTQQGQLEAYSAVCPHLGCIVEWDASRSVILCPCHDARFNALNGSVISGPSPAPLPRLALSVEGDAIYVSEA